MDQCSLLELLSQAAAGEAIREFLRDGVRLMLADVTVVEVSAVCEAKFHSAAEARFQ